MGYFRVAEQKKRDIKVYYQTKNYYGAGVYYDDQKQRYIRYSPNSKSGLTTLLKRVSNKKVRKAKEIHNHCQYKRLYDYWWNLL